jgi:hypothetical protein
VLTCVDPLTGETLWTRNDPKIPRRCELFGDDEFVFAADATEQEIHAINMMDGTVVDRRPLPNGPWMLTAGRNLAFVESPSRGEQRPLKLTVIDATTSETLVDVNCEFGSRMTAVEPNLVIVYQPSGKLQVVDVARGKLLVDQAVDAAAGARDVYALRSRDDLFVAVSGSVRTDRNQIIGRDYPLVNGQVYAFHLASGKPLWPSAAVVRNRGFALAVPEDIPLLVFVDKESQQDAGGSRAKLRLLCLDKRTGQGVFRDDDLPDTSIGAFRVRVESPTVPPASSENEVGGRIVSLEMSARHIRLAATDEPRPPEPPAHDDLTAARAFADTGLRAVVRRLGDALKSPADENQAPDDDRGGGPNRRGGG